MSLRPKRTEILQDRVHLGEDPPRLELERGHRAQRVLPKIIGVWIAVIDPLLGYRLGKLIRREILRPEVVAL